MAWSGHVYTDSPLLEGVVSDSGGSVQSHKLATARSVDGLSKVPLQMAERCSRLTIVTVQAEGERASTSWQEPS